MANQVGALWQFVSIGVGGFRQGKVMISKNTFIGLVATAQASQTSHHRLTASGFFPVPLMENSCMVMLLTDTYGYVHFFFSSVAADLAL